MASRGRTGHDHAPPPGRPPAAVAAVTVASITNREALASAADLAFLQLAGIAESAKKPDGLQAALDSIAKMAPEDRALAERVHATVSASAPELSPKTWYGMPAYVNADGKVVVSFKNAGK